MKFKTFKEYVNSKGKLVKPREEVKADYHDKIPKAPEGHKAPYVASKGIKVKGDQGLGDVGDKNMVWEPDTEVPSSKKKIVDVLDEQVGTVKQQAIDKQIYAKHPKGSHVDKATADLITQMYEKSGLDPLDSPPTGPDNDGMYVIEQKSVGAGHSGDSELSEKLHTILMTVLHDPDNEELNLSEIIRKVTDELNQHGDDEEAEPEDVSDLLHSHFPELMKILEKKHRDPDHDHHEFDPDDVDPMDAIHGGESVPRELARQKRMQHAGGYHQGEDDQWGESAFGKYVESKDAFKMMQDHPGKSCKKAHAGETHEEWKKSKKSDKEESKDDKEESKDDKEESKDDNKKSKFDMMKDHPFKSCNSVHKNKTHEEWKKYKK